ncbi:hypothetical protein LINGRAHAP2_LOCUS30431, partial [Linum grandiflorum]
MILTLRIDLYLLCIEMNRNREIAAYEKQNTEDDYEYQETEYQSDGERIDEVGWGSEEDMEDDRVRFPELNIERDMYNPEL